MIHGYSCKSSKKLIPILTSHLFYSMSTDTKAINWQKRKKVGSFPSPVRSGCTMAYWTAKGIGIMFGGVTDEDLGDEGMKSVFWNELFGYKTDGAGRWIMMGLKKPKRKPGGGRARGDVSDEKNMKVAKEQPDKEVDEDETFETYGPVSQAVKTVPQHSVEVDEPDDPLLSTPLMRYNAMLAILRNTLYM
jgi:hypothetical protein